MSLDLEKLSSEERKQLSFEDILDSAGTMLVASEDLDGDQWGPIINRDKSPLVGVPLVIVSWRFNDGDKGEFVSCEVITKDSLRFIVNDSSTGIYQQLKTLTLDRQTWGPLACPKGFKRSDYTYTDEKGKELPATTFYIDTSL